MGRRGAQTLRAVIIDVLGGCFLEIGVCFLHNATQREIKEATKSHRRKTTAARFCVSRKNGGLLAEKQAPPKNGGVLVFPVRTALTDPSLPDFPAAFLGKLFRSVLHCVLKTLACAIWAGAKLADGAI